MVKSYLLKAAAAVFIGGLLFSCSGATVEVVDKSFNEEAPERYKLNVESSLYTSADADLNAALTPLNDSLTALMSSYVENFTEVINFMKDSMEVESSFVGELTVKDTVYSATEDLVSVKYTVYEYTGGAHGNTVSIALNYSPKEKKFIEKDQLFKVEKSVVDSLLQSRFVNTDSLYYGVPTVDVASSVNVAGNEVIFVYDRYVLGPYSAGEVEIKLPVAELGL